MSASEVHSSEVRGKLKEHSDQIANVYSRWFSNTSQRPQFKGFLLVEHAVPGAAVYFYANANFVLQRLAPPKYLDGRQEELRGHLGADTWKQWEALSSHANSHLDSALQLWNEIREDVSAIAAKAGFFASNGPNNEVPDIYWPEQFVASIWQEKITFAREGVHSWQRVKVVDETVLLTMSTLRHAAEPIHVWTFESSSMIRGQSLDALHEFMRAWADEVGKMEPKLSNLESERQSVENQANQFRLTLESLESDYARTGSLFGACPTCKPWLDELRPLSQSSAF